MAGTRAPRWENTADIKYQDALKHPDFLADLETVNYQFKAEYRELAPLIMGLIKKYDLPRGCYALIKDRICFDGEEVTRKTSPIFLVSKIDDYVGPQPEVTLDQFEQVAPKNRVSLELTGEIQKQDLLDFIHSNWKLIESKLTLAEPLRPKSVKAKQMDKIHLRVLELREKEHKSYREIAVLTGLTETNISKILVRLRKQRK